MKSFKWKLLSLSFLCSPFFLPQLAHARLMTECGVGYVNGVPQNVCWSYEDPGGGGGGGGGSGGGEGGGAGGGGGGVAVSLPGVPGVRVSVTAKRVETDNLSCGDEMVLLQREVQYYLVKQPLLKIDSAVTLRMTRTGERQVFIRKSNSGSLQFLPSGACRQ